MRVLKKKTGIADLDTLLEDTTLDESSMVIDKAIFDATILPLLNGSVNLSVDDRFEHLKNIWMNYASEYGGREADSKPLNNGVFMSFKIVDENNQVVATTPSLLQNDLVNGTNDLAATYNQMTSTNPAGARALLRDNVSILSTSSKDTVWGKFLDEYDNKSATVDSQGLMEE